MAFDHSSDLFGDVGLGKTTGDVVWQPYLRVNLWDDWGVRARTTYSGTDVVELLGGGRRLQLGGGLTARINPSLSLYADADCEFALGHSDGGKRESIRGAVGLRYSW